MRCDASVAIQYQRSRKETDAKGLFSKNYLMNLPIEAVLALLIKADVMSKKMKEHSFFCEDVHSSPLSSYCFT